MKLKTVLAGALLALAPSLALAQVQPGFPSANQVYAGPASGPAAQPTFRALVPADLANGVAITVNPYTPQVAFPGTQPFQINETVTGTCTTTNNNCYYNMINIPSDNAVVGSGTSGTFVSGIGLYTNWNFGGAAMTGQRIGQVINVVLQSTTGNTARTQSYSALAAQATANANDNGTGVTLGTASGHMSAVNFITTFNANATNYVSLQGGEVDVAALSGSSMFEKAGWQIVQLANDAVQGTTFDSALVITNQSGAVGWKNGIVFGGHQGVWPFSSGATAIACINGCGTLGSVLDFSGATISSNFLNAPGFSVTGAGSILTSSTTAPTVGAGQLGIWGSTSTPTLSNTGSGAITLTNGGGLHIQGNGSVNDIVAVNKNASTIFNVPTGTTNLNVVGTLTAPTVNATSSFQANGAAGASRTCTVNQALTLIFTSGILTGGTCNS